MNIILMNIGFGLMTVTTVVLYVTNRRLIKRLNKTSETLEATDKAVKASLCLIGNLSNDRIDKELSFMHKAEVEERTEPIPYFAVYRKGLTEKHDIIRVGYDPSDPDDREYKRIHAEEVAETLNEKP